MSSPNDSRLTLASDPNWPTALSWLSGDFDRDGPASVKVLGVPLCRGAVTKSRCDLAPQAIRRALSLWSTHDVANGNDLRRLRVEDHADLEVRDLSIEEATPKIRVGAHRLAGTADAVVFIGGNNAITRPAFLGMAKVMNRFGLLTFDAHLDLRDLAGGLNNGNPVRALLEDGLPGANIVQIGIQSFANSADYAKIARNAGIDVVPVEAIATQGIEVTVADALDRLAEHVDSIYVDLDLDVLDRAYAPGCAGARPGGLSPVQLRKAAYYCGCHPKVRALDLVELDPDRDVNDVTALAGAVIFLVFASGLLRRNSKP